MIYWHNHQIHQSSGQIESVENNEYLCLDINRIGFTGEAVTG